MTTEKPKRHTGEDLPLMIRIAVKAGGLDAALGLTRNLGGRLYYVPRADYHLPDEHALVRAVGRRTAEAIQAEFGGFHNRIPTGRGLKRYHAAHLIAEGHTTANEIATLVGITAGEVFKIKARMRKGEVFELPGTRRKAVAAA